MFTGIVEEVGTVKGIESENGFYVVDVESSKVLEDVKIGDSIAVNGVCLTVKEFTKHSFKADVMGETLNKTNLGDLSADTKVNLERAMSIKDRFGGHIVSGHVDGQGTIINIEPLEDGTWFTIEADYEVLNHIVYKGSITIDGISLTVAYVDDKMFKVSIIPHTINNTILKYKKVHSSVNLECDIIGKYIEKFLNIKEKDMPKESRIDMEFLIKNGF